MLILFFVLSVYLLRTTDVVVVRLFVVVIRLFVVVVRLFVVVAA